MLRVSHSSDSACLVAGFFEGIFPTSSEVAMTSTAQPPNPSRLYRRSSFQALLKNGARRVGYEVMFQYWSEGLIVHYRKMRDNPLSLLPADYVWDILNVHFTEMTDDKIKELLVRWRMGL